jgi:acyl transferase domain-containing protein
MSELDIAIIGMAGRFPGADDVGALWRHVLAAEECATTFGRDELLAEGLAPETVDRPDFVGVRGVLGAADRFDAAFFGYSPQEAQYTDPQHRVLLEVAWNAFENAGYAPDGFSVPVGVFTGCSGNTYQQAALRDGPGDWKDGLLARIGNQSDFLSTRISYKLNLTGPSMTVHTACSSSLVALHLAGQSLLSGECDVALAGGVAVRFPQVGGHIHAEDGIYSPDGRCRAYTVRGRGLFSGNGAAAVVLKRLDDAVADGDFVHAVVKATAVNNDGRDKIGYTAPGESGQASAMRAALKLAGVDPAEVGYIEGHGTGTPFGDGIEIAALRSVYDGQGRRCALGSVKSNVGHLDAAAGITGLIKAALAVRHGLIPPQPDLADPHPALAGGSLYLTGEALPWPSARRIASVNALGLGGTNAHAILEGPPLAAVPAERRHSVGGRFLMPLSAASADSLTAMVAALPDDLDALRGQPVTPADVSATLLEGRSALPYRAVVLDGLDGVATGSARRPDDDARVAFVYAGDGYRGMARRLLGADQVFAEEIAAYREVFAQVTGLDLVADGLAADADPHPCAVHAVQVALARTFIRRGVRPAAQLGVGLGGYAAAVVGGSLSTADALRLVLLLAQPERLREELRRTDFATPAIPWISGVTGVPITRADLSDPDHWTRPAARLEEGLRALGASVLLEIGPGGTATAIRSMRTAEEESDDGDVLAQAFARLYCAGARFDPRLLYGGADFRKAPLSGYRFERTRHWPASAKTPPARLTTPSWARLPRLRAAGRPPGRLVLVGYDLPGAEHVSTPGELRAALSGGGDPRVVIGPEADAEQVVRLVSTAVDTLGHADVALLSTRAAAVDDGDVLHPERAGAVSALRALGRQHPGLRWQAVDLPPHVSAEAVLRELAEAPDGSVRALRPSGRWGAVAVPVGADGYRPAFRDGGTYVFTAGAARSGTRLAAHLRAEYGAKVVLADSADGQRLTSLFERLGRLDGVFHAVAEPATWSHDVTALERALRGRDHDFCVLLCPSRSGPGEAANGALRAFAQERWRRGDERWLAVSGAAEPDPRVVETVVAQAGAAVTDVPEGHRPDVVEGPQSSDVLAEVSRLWREVLGEAPSDPHQSFFALGGHSLMGLRLISRVRDRFGVPLDYATLVENATAARLADWVAACAAPPPATVVAGPSPTLSELLKLVAEEAP